MRISVILAYIVNIIFYILLIIYLGIFLTYLGLSLNLVKLIMALTAVVLIVLHIVFREYIHKTMVNYAELNKEELKKRIKKFFSI